MSRRDDIDTAYWNDPDVHSLTAPARLVYIWSFTNDRAGMAGIYLVPRAAIVLETGHDQETVDGALTELQGARFLFYDGSWMWVRTRIKHLNTRTVQMCKAVAKQVCKVPVSHEYRVMLLEQDGSSVWRSRDDVTTLNAEVSAIADPHGSHPGLTPNGVPPQGAVGDTPMPPGWHKGKGKGEGKGPQGRGAGEGTSADFFQMADEMGVDRGYVQHYLSRFTANKRKPTISEMRALLEKQRPSEAA